MSLCFWQSGKTASPSAFERLMPLVYPHLREVAAAYIHEREIRVCSRPPPWSTKCICA